MSSAPPETSPRPARPPVHDPLREENIKLVGRVQQLRRALEAAAQENGQLRRDLARARAETRAARAARRAVPAPAGSDRFERSSRIRVMLSDSHSRNP